MVRWTFLSLDIPTVRTPRRLGAHSCRATCPSRREGQGVLLRLRTRILKPVLSYGLGRYPLRELANRLFRFGADHDCWADASQKAHRLVRGRGLLGGQEVCGDDGGAAGVA